MRFREDIIMPNVHTPERLPMESFEQYKIRRKQSHSLNNILDIYAPRIRMHFLSPKIKDTKHTRANSSKRKGAL